MLMLHNATVLIYLLCFPALARWLARHQRWASVLGPVVLCYAGGMLLSFSGLLQPHKVALSLSEVVVPLAIPLLLMGRNLWVEIRQTGKSLLSFGLACFSVCLVSTVCGVLFAPQLPQSWQMAGMVAGTYSGGTPNMASIGQALAVQQELFLWVQAADVVTGGLFLMLLFSVMKPLASRFLRPFDGDTEMHMDETAADWRIKEMGLGLLASVVIAASSLGASVGLTGGISVPLVMCLLTFGGLLASAWPRLNRLRGTDLTGDYLIQVFCVAIGAQLQLSTLLSGSFSILLFVAVILAGAVLLQLLLAWLLKLDVDSSLIAMSAAIYGPPFIAPVAEAIRNRSLIGPGLTLGVLGYALGTWLGLAVAYGVKSLLGV
ncbi:MAG: DUF819 family protein [Candidatus Sericytochromatia bacterium]|nr:DUF819 family protein [Candidatus Sericytochromatia bacterium]